HLVRRERALALEELRDDDAAEEARAARDDHRARSHRLHRLARILPTGDASIAESPRARELLDYGPRRPEKARAEGERRSDRGGRQGGEHRLSADGHV